LILGIKYFDVARGAGWSQYAIVAMYDTYALYDSESFMFVPFTLTEKDFR